MIRKLIPMTTTPKIMNSDLPAPPKLERQNAMEVDRVCSTCPWILDAATPSYAIQCADCFKDIKTKRPCNRCGQFKIAVSEPEWKKICSTCFKVAGKRPCVSCKEMKINDFEPAWRSICKDCYSNDSMYRRCADCGNNTIKPGTAKYVNSCGPCWLEKREKTHIACPTCPDQRLKIKKGQDMCRDCMRERGLIRSK